MKKPMNARLEWRGRKLFCKSIPVAEVWFALSDLKWHSMLGLVGGFGNHDTMEQARRAINRRFGITEEAGR